MEKYPLIKIKGGNRLFAKNSRKIKFTNLLKLKFPNLPFVYIKFGEQKHSRWNTQ